MDEKRIKEVVEGISISSDTRIRILKGCKDKWDQRNKRIMMVKKTMKVSICGIIVMALLLIIPLTNKENNFELTVYAAMSDGTSGPVLLDSKKEVLLQLQNTPVGRGYIFEVTLPDKYAFKCVPAEENQPLFTIYQEENNIYWIPDIQTAGNIYNRDTERMEPQIFNGEVRLCKFDIYIYNPDNVLEEKLHIEFRVEGNECSVRFD